MKIHIVKQGDTLYSLSKKYGVTVEEMIKLNPQLKDPNKLDVGMKVKVPSTKLPTGGYEIIHKHVVKEGDTMWKLAKAWGIPLDVMIAANPHLKNPNVLLIGQVVNIPKPKDEHAVDHVQENAGANASSPNMMAAENEAPANIAPLAANEAVPEKEKHEAKEAKESNESHEVKESNAPKMEKEANESMEVPILTEQAKNEAVIMPQAKTAPAVIENTQAKMPEKQASPVAPQILTAPTVTTTMPSIPAPSLKPTTPAPSSITAKGALTPISSSAPPNPMKPAQNCGCGGQHDEQMIAQYPLDSYNNWPGYHAASQGYANYSMAPANYSAYSGYMPMTAQQGYMGMQAGPCTCQDPYAAQVVPAQPYIEPSNWSNPYMQGMPNFAPAYAQQQGYISSANPSYTPYANVSYSPNMYGPESYAGNSNDAAAGFPATQPREELLTEEASQIEPNTTIAPEVKKMPSAKKTSKSKKKAKIRSIDSSSRQTGQKKSMPWING